MRLLVRVAGSIAVITLLVGVVVAGSIGLGGGLLLAAPICGVLVLVVHRRRSHADEIGWSGSPAVATAPPPALAAHDGLHDDARRVAPTAAPRGWRSGVAGSLARVEARELIASPWLHVGIVLCLVILAMLGVLFADDLDRSWLELFGIATLLCHPLAAFAIVAAHRNRTRGRRDGCEELFEACPADADVRTLGHLATSWVVALLQVGFIVLLAVLVAMSNHHIYGPLGPYVVAALLACAVIGAGAVALGVTLGRWAPWGLVPFVAVMAVGVASARINEIGAPAYATDRMLATLVATTGIDPVFLPQLWWERVAWLGALAAIVAVLGLLGGRYTRVASAVLVGAVAVAVVSAVLIVRPATQQADDIADLVADPIAHSTCVAAGPDVEVCAYEGYEGLARDTAVEIGPVVAAVPDGVLDDVVFVAYYEGGVDRLTAEVQAELDGRGVELPPHALRLRFNSHPENFEAVRLRMAARAVGLPADTTDDELPTSVGGRARGVVALWLATRGLDDDARERLITADASGDPSTPTPPGAIWPGTCHEENQAVQWSSTDLDAARVLFSLGDERVRRVLGERWDELTGDDVTTDQLLVAMGASPLGPPEAVEVRQDLCA